MAEVEELSYVFTYTWTLIDIEKEATTILSPMIKFRGEESFRVGLNIGDRVEEGRVPLCTVFLIAAHLNKLGLKATRVKLFSFSHELELGANFKMIEISRKNDEPADGTFQLFATPYNGAEGVEDNTLTFDVCLTGNFGYVDSFRAQRMDCLLKEHLWSSIKNPDFTDFVILTRGIQFPVHQFILAARSPVFAALFKTKKRSKSEIVKPQQEIDYVDPACMEQFLKFIYTGEIEGPIKNCQMMMKLATTFQVNTVKNLCEVASHEIDEHAMMTSLDSTLKYSAWDTWTNLITKPSALDDEAETNNHGNYCILKCPWNMDWVDDEMLLYLTDSEDFEYEGKKLFRAKIRAHKVNNPNPVMEDEQLFMLTFLSYRHRHFGCRVEEVSYRFLLNDGLSASPIVQMQPTSPPSSQTILQQFNCTFKRVPPFDLIFYVKFSTSVPNFGYKFVDSTWEKELWAETSNKKFTDVEFVLEEESISAHRALLSARSPVFAAMFSSGMEECQTGQVHLDDVDPSTFRDFLKFLYTGMLEASTKKDQLLVLADKYQVETLVHLCKFATQYDVKDLTDAFFSL